ncbi:MAG: mycothiol system anti-sigma-R factor [Acidimicrobiia bacterium]|jgi:mycothiol system anti-sigma-R factor
MDCDKAYRRMYRYLDGEITVVRRWRITRHLDKCPPCAHGYDFEVELREVIATRCRDTVPPELKRRIAEAIESAEAPAPQRAEQPPA